MSNSNSWPAGTPQEVIDEIETDLNQEADAYKQWLRKSISGDAMSNEAKSLPDEETPEDVADAAEKFPRSAPLLQAKPKT